MGEGGGGTGSLGLSDADYYIWKKTATLLQSTRSCVQSPGINRNGKEHEKECVCDYNRIILQLNQLYFNKKKRKPMKKSDSEVASLRI